MSTTAANTKPAATPVSYKILLVLCLCFFNEAFTFSNLFSYIGFMVWDFHMTDDVDQVGYYAGYLGSCFSLASFVSSFWWGKMSDKYGKRPILIIGATGATVTCLIFGFSTSLWMAMGVRFLSGLVNGNIGVVKGYTSDITDSSNQAKTMSYMQLSWGLGNIMGAVLGGVLARPCQQHPSLCDASSFFGKYPYALPNLINTAFSFGGLVLLWIFIPRQTSSYQVVENEEEATVFHGEDETIGAESNSVELTSLQTEQQQQQQQQEQQQQEQQQQQQQEQQQGILSVSVGETSLSSSSSEVSLSSSSDYLISSDSSSSSSSETSQTPFWKYKAAMTLCAAYGALGAAHTVFEEAWPLWALSPTLRGGLSFTPSELGYVGAIQGVVAIIIQLTIFLPMVNKLGFLRLFQLGAFLGILSFIPVPLLTYLTPHLPVMWGGLSVLVVIRVLAGQCAFTACFGLLSNSIPIFHVGAVHGFAQSGVALTRAISPAIAGTLLAWGYSNGLGFPLNQNLVFMVAAILSAVAGILTIRLPTSLNVPYAESHPQFMVNSKNSSECKLDGESASSSSSSLEKQDKSMMMMSHA